MKWRMREIIIFGIGALTGAAIAWATVLTRRNSAEHKQARYDAGRATISGINAKRSQEKEDAKARIFALAGRQVEISNNDVEQLLGVSDATATNYLSELESEGKLIQVGNEGRSVRYRKPANG